MNQMLMNVKSIIIVIITFRDYSILSLIRESLGRLWILFSISTNIDKVFLTVSFTSKLGTFDDSSLERISTTYLTTFL